MLSLVHVASTNSDRRVSYRSCQCLLKFSYPIGAHTSFKLNHHAVYIKDLYIFCYNVNCLTIGMALITLLLRLPMNETRGVNYIFVFLHLSFWTKILLFQYFLSRLAQNAKFWLQHIWLNHRTVSQLGISSIFGRLSSLANVLQNYVNQERVINSSHVLQGQRTLANQFTNVWKYLWGLSVCVSFESKWIPIV